MNKIKIVIIGVALLAATVIHAQTNTDNTQIKSSFLTFVQNVESNRSITATVYPMYAPSIVVNGKKDTFGGGVAVLTPVSAISALSLNPLAQHSFIGLRFDYLAHSAFASTVGVGMKGDFQLWSHNFELYGQTGANIPFSGFGVKNGTIGAMVGTGLYTDLWHPSPNITLGIQFEGEKWTQFPGPVLLGGPVFHVSF